MPLVTTQSILKDAYDHHYAVGAFAAHNLEILKSVVSAAESRQSPIIIQTTPGTIRYVGVDYLRAMVGTAANEASVPVALHLDHGDSYETVVKCLRAGYTSVMIDGSTLPFEENVALVQKVTETAHIAGVPVEAELGTIGGVEDDMEVSEEDAGFTSADTAENFVKRTNIDTFAPAYGTAHGLYKTQPNLQFDLLEDIASRVDVPLVMHGASGVSDEGVQKSVIRGASKVNFSTELKDVFAKGLRAYLAEHPDESDPRKYFSTAKQRVEDIAKQKIDLLLSQRV